eukprot:354655-Chlamydomonas_euryale.AAC.4
MTAADAKKLCRGVEGVGVGGAELWATGPGLRHCCPIRSAAASALWCEAQCGSVKHNVAEA